MQLVGFHGGQLEKYGFNGGVKRKNIGFKGEATQKIPSNFAVMAFLIMQTAKQNAKNQHFLIIIIMKSLFIKR